MQKNCRDRLSVARFRQHYRAMSAQLQKSFYRRILDKELAKNEARNQQSQRFVGSYIRRLAGKTPTSQVLDVTQVFKQHKLTLVEFRASWCGPCRQEMPKYYKLQKQCSRKGFGMLGVSLDTNYNKWVQAIAKDSLRMPHLSELQGGSGEDIRRFGITGTLATVLVGSAGRVVAVDISYPRLHKKLQQAL